MNRHPSLQALLACFCRSLSRSRKGRGDVKLPQFIYEVFIACLTDDLCAGLAAGCRAHATCARALHWSRAVQVWVRCHKASYFSNRDVQAWQLLSVLCFRGCTHLVAGRDCVCRSWFSLAVTAPSLSLPLFLFYTLMSYIILCVAQYHIWHSSLPCQFMYTLNQKAVLYQTKLCFLCLM